MNIIQMTGLSVEELKNIVGKGYHGLGKRKKKKKRNLRKGEGADSPFSPFFSTMYFKKYLSSDSSNTGLFVKVLKRHKAISCVPI